MTNPIRPESTCGQPRRPPGNSPASARYPPPTTNPQTRKRHPWIQPDTHSCPHRNPHPRQTRRAQKPTCGQAAATKPTNQQTARLHPPGKHPNKGPSTASTVNERPRDDAGQTKRPTAMAIGRFEVLTYGRLATPAGRKRLPFTFTEPPERSRYGVMPPRWNGQPAPRIMHRSMSWASATTPSSSMS